MLQIAKSENMVDRFNFPNLLVAKQSVEEFGLTLVSLMLLPASFSIIWTYTCRLIFITMSIEL